MKLDAVVLAAGPGSRMVELTRGRPKCLLPVGNHSLIWFAITSLKYIGVERIIILVPDTHEQDIKQYCHKKFNNKGLILEFASVPVKADCGTAESILSIRDKIREDFIVFSCDTIVDPKSLLALLNHYRLYDPMLTMLLADNPSYFQSLPIPGRREKETYPRDIITIEPLEKLDQTTNQDHSANKVVFLHSERDLGKNLRIKNRELALHPSLEVCSKFLDTHIYILKRQALDFLSQHKDKTVLKGEVIPLLIARQFSRLESDSYDRCRDDDDDDDEDLSGFTRRSDHELELKERLESFNPRNVAQSNYLHKPKLSRPTACHALVIKNHTAHRANTLRSYLDCNREAKSILGLFDVKNLTFIKECMIGDDTRVGEKCLLKGGSIGNGCKIGDKVKLFNCVVMDNVEIDPNVTISESIISSNSRIGPKCDLKSCVVGQRQVIAGGRKANCEVIIDDGYVIDLSDPLVSDND